MALPCAAAWNSGPGFRWKPLPEPVGSGGPGFVRESAAALGITFTNALSPDRLVQFQNLMNGSGVAAADVDGDGAPEVIVVETALATGARLAVWGAEGRRAATPHIGQTHRWLAPVGAADFDGDGKIEIAVVDRPHLARILTLWRYEAGSLRLAATASGFTNHRIGWDYIAGGVRQCAGAPEMIVADPDWRRILAVRFDGAQVTAKDLGRYSAEAMRAATLCRG